VPVPDHGLDVPLIRGVQVLPAIGGRVGDELDPGRASATRLEVDGEEGEEEASDRPGEECEREEPGPATRPRLQGDPTAKHNEEARPRELRGPRLVP
jgi:hypothetical protein